jgi:Protein of unknown function (DUF3417)
MEDTQEIGIAALTELALNLRSLWHRGTHKLWAQPEPDLWALTHNPWAVLQTVSRRRIEEFLARPEVRQRVAELTEQRRRYLAAPAWFQQAHGEATLTRVAYFSMEFALSEALPIYSGRLGNVAGDQLKAARDLGLYADSANGVPQERQVRARNRKLDAAENAYEYGARIPARRSPGDYTPRLVPYHPAAVVPLEAREILWQR